MNDYSFVERLLHRLALGPQAIREMAFDLEARALDPDPELRRGPHVFVSSLARAGTTILVRDLHATGVFASLTYGDMPFVLAPNLWKKVAGNSRQGLERAERAHGDGIEVDAESPEAFEEVFWRTFGPSGGAGNIDQEAAQRFEQHIRSVTQRYGQARYLSKNNASICRLPWLCERFPKARVLVPFRRPEDHAASLLRQHQRFVRKQSEDRFVLQYMNWLGHHEFGLGYRPPLGRPVPAREALDTVEYWLDEWLHVFSGLLEDKARCGEQLQLVSHERLCRGDAAHWQQLMGQLGLPAETPNSYRPKPGQQDRADGPSLPGEFEDLFAALESSAH